MATNAHGLRYFIDTSAEKFGDAITLAHLALNSFDDGHNSNNLDIYTVSRLIDRDWFWELEDFEYEYLTHYIGTFKDGSKLTVCAWASDPADAA